MVKRVTPLPLEGLMQTIAAYLRFHLGRLDKLQGKVMTQKLEWWIILMVDCVTHF